MIETPCFLSIHIKDITTKRYDVGSFSVNDNLLNVLPSLYVVVKGLDQFERSARSRDRLLHGRPNVADIPREPSKGGIARINIREAEKLYEAWNFVIPVDSLDEPHHIDVAGTNVIVTTCNSVLLCKEGQTRIIKSPFFRNLHSSRLILSPQGQPQNIVVASTGIDSVIDVDISNPEHDRNALVTNSWTAYQAGFKTESGQSIVLNTHDGVLRNLSDYGIIASLDNLGPLGMIPYNRPLSINDALIVPEDFPMQDKFGIVPSSKVHCNILSTTFLQGQLLYINLESGEHKTLIQGFKHPHGLTLNGGNFNILSTREGTYYISDNTLNCSAYDFSSLMGKDDFDTARNREWLPKLK